MTKADIVNALHDTKPHIYKKDIEELLEGAVDMAITGLISGEKIKISRFGVLELARRKQRVGRDAVTGAPVSIPESTVPVFRASKSLKMLISEALERGN